MRIACILLSFVLMTGNLKSAEMTEAYPNCGQRQQENMEEKSEKEPDAERAEKSQEPQSELTE